MVGYSVEQLGHTIALESPDERRWRFKHGRGNTAAEDAALQRKLDGACLNGRGNIKFEDDSSSTDDGVVGGDIYSDVDSDEVYEGSRSGRYGGGC